MKSKRELGRKLRPSSSRSKLQKKRPKPKRLSSKPKVEAIQSRRKLYQRVGTLLKDSQT